MDLSHKLGYLEFILILLFVHTVTANSPTTYNFHQFLNDTIKNNSSLQLSNQSESYLLATRYTIRVRQILDDEELNNVGIFSILAHTTIEARAIHRKNVIVFQQKNLNIQLENVKVINTQVGELLNISTQRIDNEEGLYMIHLVEDFNSGENLKIHIPYQIRVNCTQSSICSGFFWGKNQVNISEEAGYYWGTKFDINQGSNAVRTVFPVLNSSATRPTFKVIIGRQDNENYYAVSNADFSYSEKNLDNEGWIWDHFEEIALPPTNIFMFVGRYEDFTMTSSRNGTISIRVWNLASTLSCEAKNQIGPDAAMLLKSYEEKFKLPYPLKTLDIFIYDAQTYSVYKNRYRFRSSVGVVQLFVRDTTHFATKYREFETTRLRKDLSLQLSQQWFGGIVSCQNTKESSPGDYFLKMGLPPYLSLLWENETTDSLKAFFTDSPSQLPAILPTRRDRGYKDRFTIEDEIKLGLSLLRMVEGFLNKKIMDMGLIDILLEKRYGQVCEDEILNGIQEAVMLTNSSHLLPYAGMSVKDVMDDWIVSDVYPIVIVKIEDNETISISQEELISKSDVLSAKTNSSSDRKSKSKRWWIPLKMVTENGISNDTIWIPKFSNETFQNGSTKYKMNTTDGCGWILANPDPVAQYTVIYDSILTKRISQQLVKNHTVISVWGRYQLFSDYLRALKRNFTSVEDIMELTRYFGNETNYLIWDLLDNFSDFQSGWTLENLQCRYFGPKVEQILGVTKDGQLSKATKENWYFLELCGRLQAPNCMKFFADGLQDAIQQPPNTSFPFRGVLSWERGFCYAIAGDDENHTNWNMLMDALQTRTDPGFCFAVVQSFTCTTDVSLLSDILTKSLNRSSIVANWKDSLYYSGHNYKTAASREIFYNFLKENVISGNVEVHHFARFLSESSRLPMEAPQEFANAAREFINENKDIFQEYMPELELNLEKISICPACQWRDTTGKRIAEWMIKQK